MTRYFFSVFACFGLILSLSACGTTDGVDVYHWRPVSNIGPNQFVRDHNYCIRDADAWPLDTSPGDLVDYFSPGPHDPRHRLDSDEHRVWASFVPYPGAQVIYVNDVNSSSYVDGEDYASCMESFGYVQALPPENRYNLIEDRRIGYRGEY